MTIFFAMKGLKSHIIVHKKPFPEAFEIDRVKEGRGFFAAIHLEKRKLLKNDGLNFRKTVKQFLALICNIIVALLP